MENHNHDPSPSSETMSALAARLIIALDEWPGIIICLHLRLTGSSLFWWFAIPWAIAVYVISYPMYWWCRESSGIRTPMRFVFKRWAERERGRLRNPVPTCQLCSRPARWETWPSTARRPDGSDAIYTCNAHLPEAMSVQVGDPMAPHWLVYPLEHAGTET